jgi:hypothetical protein
MPPAGVSVSEGGRPKPSYGDKVSVSFNPWREMRHGVFNIRGKGMVDRQRGKKAEAGGRGTRQQRNQLTNQKAKQRAISQTTL